MSVLWAWEAGKKVLCEDGGREEGGKKEWCCWYWWIGCV